MIEFENYKDNLDIDDKHGYQGIQTSKSVIYNGPHSLCKDSKNDKRCDVIPPLAASIVGLNNTATAFSKKTGSYNIWTDIDAQENYLNNKPTCYLILGKPGCGAYALGEAMSKKYNCIHLCPRNIITDEIDQESPTGKCIAFNLKQQKILTYDLILSLLKKKLKSSVVEHRGYVMSGLPLISSDRRVKYLTSTLLTEEAVLTVDDLLYDTIANLKKKPPRKAKVASGSPGTSITSDIDEQEEEEVEELVAEEDVEEEAEEPPVALPKFVLDTCSDLIVHKKKYLTTKKTILLQQFFSLLKTDMPPDVVIYLTSPDKDLVAKKSHKYFNYLNNLFTFEHFHIKYESDIRWPAKYSMSDYVRPHETHIFNPKYSCRQPINFEANSAVQMCNYKNDILPSIEEKLKDFDQKHVIKIDARNSVHQMMYHINERLVLLSINPVLIPEPLYLEEPPDDLEDFWKLVEELNVIRSGVLSFSRYPSLWLNRCPVELKKRRSVKGKPKYAVTFFKHVYLLSSLAALVAFCRNPRPYLKFKYLEPTCRIIVMGTPHSGKTLISHCLSWLFDAQILSYNLFLEEEKLKKYTTYARTILSEIIPTIEDTRLEKWQVKETERKLKLEEWHTSVSKPLKKYVPILIEILKYSSRGAVSEAFMGEEESKELDEQLLKEYDDLQNQLSFLPFLDDVDECIDTLVGQNLVKYAPLNLVTETEKPAIPVLGDDDVTEAVSNYITTNELQKELEPTTEELMTELVRVLFQIDEESNQNDETYGKFIIDGFPSDLEFWDYLSDANLIPDHTITLIENREIEPELIQHYTDISKNLINYQERYALANDPLIKIKLLTTDFPDSKRRDTAIILQHIMLNFDTNLRKHEDELGDNEGNDEMPDPEFVALLTASIEKFREDWDSVKIKIEDSFKSYIETELENKSDVDIVEEILLKLRKSYYLTCEPNEDEEPEPPDEEETTAKDMLTYNDFQYLGETNVYCPIAFYDYGVLWEGKAEFGIKYDNKIYNFSKEENMEIFQKDVSRYQEYYKPLKSFPPLRLCVIGCIGSGKTTISKLIAKELGLLHVDFTEFINNDLMPRHFKKVGRQYENSVLDTPIDEEGVTEFQMDEGNENLVSDILGNEHELRAMIYNYFERGAPIISVLMLKVLRKLWFEMPFKNTGFVLDGYPRLPSDVEDMVAGYCIPDLIIELEGGAETSLERLSPKMYKTWKTQLNEAKIVAKKKLDTERQIWMSFVTKQVVAKLIFEDLLDVIFGSMSEPAINQTEGGVIEPQLQEPPGVDTYLLKLYNETIEEYPGPVDINEWEKPDEARERIEARIESVYEVDDEGIQSLKDILMEQKIKTISINGTKPINKVLRVILFKLSDLRNRSDSLFEQNFIVNCDIADMLLLEGFYFISKFNRLCPVHVYENPKTIMNPFKIMKRKGEVFPVIHRSFIYFIFGKENLNKFRINPLKYICSNLLSSHVEYPLTIAVIGSPKSGKSVLARKLAKRYGLICISRGMAIRYILNELHWTELASRMKSTLCDGNCIDMEYVVKAVQCVLIDHHTLTYGFVFDGFPDTASEAMELLKIGLYPLIVLDVSNSNEHVYRNSQNEIYYDIIKLIPPYSTSFINDRFTYWRDNNYKVRNWIHDDIQNIFEINGQESKWQCLQDAVNHIEKRIPKIHFYLNNVKSNIVRAGFMCISEDSFRQKMSSYRDMCPLCLQMNVIKYSGYPVDKNGIVQFKNKFYWICDIHMDAVLKAPKFYLLLKDVDIPEIPAAVKTVNMKLVYENGICIVTYAENLPAQKIVRGNHKYAASYKGNTYMFCTSKCLDTFLAKPHMYYDISVFKVPTAFSSVSLKKLPNIGYLEQTVGNIITDACCAVNVLRPKYPGLDIKLSGLLFIALYLKTHNPMIDKTILPFYTKAYSVYYARCKLILDIGLRLRSMDNPFAKYPKCCEKRKYEISTFTVRKPSNIPSTSTSTTSATERASRVPVPDERFDYLCEYHKPASKVPAFLNVVDIAGLVKGAAEGQGLGNAFLSHIKACDAIFNLCRAFDDEDVIHVDGDVNPVRDLETIGEELRLKDEELLMQNFEKLDRVVSRGGDKKLKPEYDSLTRIKAVLVDEKKHIRFGDWSAADIEVLNKYLFLTSKPALYLVNLSEKDYIRKKNKWLPKLKEWIDKNDPGAPLIPFSGVLETKLMEMDPAEKQAFLKEHNITCALDKIIVQGYKALQLEYFFTAGPDEVKAWTIQKGTKAPQAAGRIHTDFEKGFIMAEVMHFKDFKEEGTEAACKAAGKYRQQGRNYVVEDGDIIFFKFNAGAGLKDAKKK